MLKVYTRNTPSGFKEFIRIMRNNNLYIHKGSGFGQLIYTNRFFRSLKSIGLGYIDNQPAVVCVVMHNNGLMHGCNIACYTKPEYRRQGFGSVIINKMVSKIDDGIIINQQFPIGFPKNDQNS